MLQNKAVCSQGIISKQILNLVNIERDNLTFKNSFILNVFQTLVKVGIQRCEAAALAQNQPHIGGKEKEKKKADTSIAKAHSLLGL